MKNIFLIFATFLIVLVIIGATLLGDSGLRSNITNKGTDVNNEVTTFDPAK